ncbi:MAG: HAMP domain-containing sensor histidine kinase [Clostridia bacterium]
MRLWKKISLVCSVILVVIVATCSTLLLLQSKNSILELTYRQAGDRQKSLASSFSQMAGYYASETDQAATSESLIRYCFTRFADSSSVLLSDEKQLYSEVELDPKSYLPITDSYEQQQFTGVIGGRNILIVGSGQSVKQNLYSVYVVEDITSVYNDIASMIWRFAFVSVAGILMGVMLIALLVRRSMQPLAVLGKTAKQIAAGDYAQRAAVQGQDEVGILAEDFNTMAEAIESHVAELTETAERQRLFIGGVTHEFKTPLTTMLLNADTLQNAYLTEEEQSTSIAFIARQCAWLERLTQKLLKLITLKGQIKRESASLERLFERVQESMAETLTQRGTPLVVECATESLTMDADLMQSVVINLVDNASKASQAGQIVRLSAYDNIIEVSDCGCGIPEAELARITEPFYMVDKSRSKKHGGTGLGLALVKEIVAVHDADLHIESKIGSGTTVRIIFPW